MNTTMLHSHEDGLARLFIRYQGAAAHRIPYSALAANAEHVETVIGALNRHVFDFGLRASVQVESPRSGCLIIILVIVVSAVPIHFWKLLTSSPGSEFVRGLTGKTPEELLFKWGKDLRKKLEDLKDKIDKDKDDDPPNGEGASGSDSGKNMAKRNTANETESHKLRQLDEPASRHDAHSNCASLIVEIVKSSFAHAAKSTIDEDKYPAIQYVSLGAYHAFRRALSAPGVAYMSLATDLDREDGLRLSHTELAAMRDRVAHWKELSEQEISVTSPNWDSSDSRRLWKGYDARGRRIYFSIEDPAFWARVADGTLKVSTHNVILAKMHEHLSSTGKMRLKAVKILKFNAGKLA